MKTYSPPEVDTIWGVWGPYYNIPKAIFYLLKGDYSPNPLGCYVSTGIGLALEDWILGGSLD